MKLDDAIARLAAMTRHPELFGRATKTDRAPLPAGHPDAWGLLTKGTLLDGSPYDHPTFAPMRDDQAWREMLARAAKLAT
jgi:hypothetical protein